MKFACLRYDNAGNLGDEIQSIAAEQFLPRIDTYLDRDNLGRVTQRDPCLVIMNGWFTHHPVTCFPPSDAIVPLFIGFHITNWNNTARHFLSPKGIAYFKCHEPIGCRDRHTMELLADKGVKSFNSKCLTLTFPKRKIEPEKGKVLLVDASHIPIPEFLHAQAISVSHLTSHIFGHETKMLMAKRLLAIYRNEASLVITTRLHCALPCIAMGVPVIFFGNPNDYRVSVLGDLNITINRLLPRWSSFLYRILKSFGLGKIARSVSMTLPIFRTVDWNPQSACIEKEKQVLKVATEALVQGKIMGSGQHI